MKILLPACLALAVTLVPHSDGTMHLRFSDARPGIIMPAGWRRYRMSRHRPAARIDLVRDHGRTVLHIDAYHAAGAIAHLLDLPATTTLRWRWAINHVVKRANIDHRRGDDAAARVYVFFNVPRSSLSWFERMKLSLAEHVLGHPLPTAALCYIWDNRHPVGSIARSPFFKDVHTIVVESGNTHAGTWQTEQRNLAADFRAAFHRAPPRITGIALASDTDNTRGDVQAWFGDVTLSPDTLPARTAGGSSP